MTLHPAVQRENVKALEVDDVIKENTIEFDFLGKDSVQYLKQVVVHRRVYHLMQKWVPRDADGRGAPAVCPHHPPSPPPPFTPFPQALRLTTSVRQSGTSCSTAQCVFKSKNWHQ